MSSLLNVATRALLANQVGLSTTGHNIANANTVGYSRQGAVLQQVPGQYTGNGYIGRGVQVQTIERAHDDFLTRQAALAQSVAAMDATRADRLAALGDVFQGGASGLGTAVNDMLNAFSDVVSAPGDGAARSVVLARADELAARFRDAHDRLSDLRQGSSARLGAAVQTINDAATRIAGLNEQIARTQGLGHSPNDLLDQRDQALRELNQQVQASTVTADDGTLSVFVGSQALVLGGMAASVALDAPDGGRASLVLERGALTQRIDEHMLGGGAVAGLLRFRNTDLADAGNELGRMALAIGTEINAQHRLGIDLNGATGRDLFAPIALADATARAGNGGNAVLQARVSDASALVASSYSLTFGAGGSVAVQRLSDGRTTSFAGPLPVQLDGLTIDVGSGAAAAGDQYLLEPFADAAGRLSLALTAPRELAVASPVQAQTGSGNTGSIVVRALAANAADSNLGATVTLTFNAGGTFDVSGSGTGNPSGLSYTAGRPIEFNGWSLTLQGMPRPGDTVTVQAAAPGYTTLNAGNAGALLGLRDKALFDGAPTSDGYAALMAKVGVRVQSAQYTAEVSTSIAGSLEAERSNVAGVNLDEEAAKLLQYQQAYQASAKMIQIAQNIFDSLLREMN